MRIKIIKLFVTLLVVFSAAEALSEVRAVWGESRGRQISFEMKISEKMPTLIIVRLHLPRGLNVVGITPEPKKRDSKKNGLKLLFTNLQMGNNHITVTADRNVKKSSIKGTIIYKDPSSGKMERRRIS